MNCGLSSGLNTALAPVRPPLSFGRAGNRRARGASDRGLGAGTWDETTGVANAEFTSYRNILVKGIFPGGPYDRHDWDTAGFAANYPEFFKVVFGGLTLPKQINEKSLPANAIELWTQYRREQMLGGTMPESAKLSRINQEYETLTKNYEKNRTEQVDLVDTLNQHIATEQDVETIVKIISEIEALDSAYDRSVADLTARFEAQSKLAEAETGVIMGQMSQKYDRDAYLKELTELGAMKLEHERQRAGVVLAAANKASRNLMLTPEEVARFKAAEIAVWEQQYNGNVEATKAKYAVVQEAARVEQEAERAKAERALEDAKAKAIIKPTSSVVVSAPAPSAPAQAALPAPSAPVQAALPATVVVSDSSMPGSLEPAAVLRGTPVEAPQTAGLFDGDMKTVMLIAGGLLLLGFMFGGKKSL